MKKILIVIICIIGIGFFFQFIGLDYLESYLQKQKIECTSVGMYGYESLTEEEQQIYNEITYAIENRLDSIEVSTLDKEILKKVHWVVSYDHCEYFWTTTYQYEEHKNKRGNVNKLVFRPVYNMTAEEQIEYQKKINSAVDLILSGIDSNVSDYEKALYVFETIVEQTTYNVESEHNQDIISVFLNHESVCRGYSYAAQYLLNELNIPCTTVFGTRTDSESHCWNLIKLNGDYYYMDVTNGEISYWQDTEYQNEVINYCYFGMSDTDMEAYEPYDYVPLPVCSATENNYFVKEGFYFTDFDESTIGSKIIAACVNKEINLMLKFETKELYDQAYEFLITNSHWADYCSNEEIAYIDQFGENVLLLRFVQ